MSHATCVLGVSRAYHRVPPPLRPPARECDKRRRFMDPDLTGQVSLEGTRKTSFWFQCFTSLSGVVFRNMSSESTRQPPGSDGEDAPEAVAELTDAKAMRALAHPVRLSLIDLLGYHEVLTATEA